jgi:CRISPR-associated endoribonuclease Cas6
MTGIGALARIDLGLEGSIDGPVRMEHVHAALCQWLDGDQHHAGRKPFTVRNLAVAPNAVHLQVTTVSVDAVRRLHSALAARPAVRLGSSHLEVGSALMTRNLDWQQLLDESAAASGMTVHLESPTIFRSGRAVSVLPTPGLVFGHLRAVWEQWAPSHLRPDIDLSSVVIFVDRLDGHTDVVQARGRSWPGFTGNVGFDLSSATPRDRRVLCALASLAPYAGIGANTTIGMGAASVTFRVDGSGANGARIRAAQETRR